jgi:hypothetical protein
VSRTFNLGGAVNVATVMHKCETDAGGEVSLQRPLALPYTQTEVSSRQAAAGHARRSGSESGDDYPLAGASTSIAKWVQAVHRTMRDSPWRARPRVRSGEKGVVKHQAPPPSARPPRHRVPTMGRRSFFAFRHNWSRETALLQLAVQLAVALETRPLSTGSANVAPAVADAEDL